MTEPCNHEYLEYCTCYALAGEPDEQCPIHGWGQLHPQCCKCGQFIKKCGYDLETLKSEVKKNDH